MVHMLPSHRRINEVQAHEIDLAKDAGLFSKATFDFMSLQARGRVNLGYTKLDQKNYFRTKRQKTMRRGEAGVLLEYFEKKRIEDPSFFFAVQLDVDDMITNIFWADSKMIIDYDTFGDVLSFDTTYQTNREHRPLASFVGLNNHRKMIVLGGALMHDETVDSFQWLLERFLGAMSGKKPKIIFTDQNTAMSKAISFVMPEHYDREIEDKRYNELQDTCNASQRIPVLKAQVPILVHDREVYTSNIFAKSQDEYMKSLSIRVNIGCEKNTLSTIYKVSKHGHTREYIVTVTEVGNISCTCLKFESMGILCCHAIRVLDVVNGVSRIPTEYILERWTKNTKGVNIKEVDKQEIEIKDPKLITMNRYRVICPIFVKMVAKASETNDGYKVVVACANELSSKLKQITEATTPSLCTSGSTRDLP
ncbi:protein FAR1-RELATED SEQUENCE 5-like [Nicotiana tabacum]|uniref:Protein FAR1-RELATED SEQUENCE 5-like n=1 Tax=Nicotiana tabacum TaxID=4097 RepID=A0AC58UC29_TOBAC